MNEKISKKNTINDKNSNYDFEKEKEHQRTELSHLFDPR
jgi:hypothetical protein